MGALILSAFILCTFPDTYQYEAPVPCIEWRTSQQLEQSSNKKMSNYETAIKLSNDTKLPVQNDNMLDPLPYTVWFRVGSSTLISIPDISQNNLQIHGYASPDGKKPEMQIDLARKRALTVTDYLVNRGFNIVSTNASVCDEIANKASCWKVDITPVEHN